MAIFSVAAAIIIVAIIVRMIWDAGRPRPRSERKEIDQQRNAALLGCLGVTIPLVAMIYSFKGSSSIFEARPLLILLVSVVLAYPIGAAGLWVVSNKLKAKVKNEYAWSHLFEPVIDHLEWFAKDPATGQDYDNALKALTTDREIMRSECQRILSTLDTTHPKDKSTAAGITAGLELVEGWCDMVIKPENT